MNNYVKYALSKLEETMEKEKLTKKKEQLGDKKGKWSFLTSCSWK